MEREYECIVLEDKLEYAIIDRIKHKENEYIFLTNTLNEKDFCIRKLKGEALVGLSDIEEFEFALSLIKEKNNELLKKIDIM